LSSYPSAQTLIAQLRGSYPTACLLSELLTVQQTAQKTIYVVRALIQIGSTTLATALAADADIEVAEDRARLRVLEVLIQPAPARNQETQNQTIAPETAADSPVNLPAVPLPEPSVPVMPAIASTPAEPEPSAPAMPAIASASAKPDLPQPSLDIEPFAAPEDDRSVQSPPSLQPVGLDWDSPLAGSSTQPLEPDFDLTSLLQPPLPELEESPAASSLFESFEQPESPLSEPLSKAAPKSEKPPKRKATDLQPIPEPPAAEIDRSEEIARIGVEMKRLGWDTKQGREHLQRTYGKRSRQELNDDELMDFLQYLELQPSSSQTPF
jgi:hypothetical protein